jgi:hypothetical protein
VAACCCCCGGGGGGGDIEVTGRASETSTARPPPCEESSDAGGDRLRSDARIERCGAGADVGGGGEGPLLTRMLRRMATLPRVTGPFDARVRSNELSEARLVVLAGLTAAGPGSDE